MKQLTVAFAFLAATGLNAQEIIEWDDTQSTHWPEQCRRVEIPSSLDGQNQPAWFYKSKSSLPQPLIVSLHTWSGGFDQKDTLSWEAIRKDFNYIHPHFRGPNNTPQACGSEYALRDIDDAITYAIKNGNVDTSEIHITGVSGGGYSTLLAYMKTKHRVKTFSAWVPISNLVDWYYESVGRANKYAYHIALATTGMDFDTKNYDFNEEEARARSPYFMQTPTQERKASKLYIYAGIHDGYTGSVPIIHSIAFFNKMVEDLGGDNSDEVPCDDIVWMLTTRTSPKETNEKIGDRDIHYHKTFNNVSITIFEGTHEILVNEVLP